MEFAEGTVFVLGAGFTKAFLPNAPLLVDDFQGDELREKFRAFPAALAVLEAELNNPDHAKGKINLERLMTRLAGGMPYDFGGGENQELDFLLVMLERVLMRRLEQALASETASPECLWLLASHVCANRNHCITFNYDDLLDQALWNVNPIPSVADTTWNPEWGYGFPCGMSEELVNRYPLIRPLSRMLLLKLHGSMNWRVPLGAKRPFEVNAVHHHEHWYSRPAGKIPLESFKALLETEPVLIPPVLTKTELVNEPVLRVIWECARSVLRDASRVVFVGYSLPITDIAAGFLFSESLGRLPADNVTIVDWSAEDGMRQKLDDILRAYRRVFPAISERQVDLGGACSWISNKLTSWLFNSAGEPIAFKAVDQIFDRDGKNIGDLRGYVEPHCQELWHGRYRGEICSANRLLFKEGKYEPEPDRGGNLVSHRLTPTVPNRIDAIDLPAGWRDLTPSDLTATPVVGR